MTQEKFPIIDKRQTAERLKFLMKYNGISPGGVQEYLGLTCVQTVYRWLEGINIPNIDNLYALSQLFNIRIDDIISGSKKKYMDSNAYQQRLRIMTYYCFLRNAA